MVCKRTVSGIVWRAGTDRDEAHVVSAGSSGISIVSYYHIEAQKTEAGHQWQGKEKLFYERWVSLLARHRLDGANVELPMVGGRSNDLDCGTMLTVL